MSHPFKWHVPPRLSNAIEQIANLKNMSLWVTFLVLNSLAKSHLNSVCTEYVFDKSENARVCAKWQWNALDWCYWVNPVTQSRVFHCHFALWGSTRWASFFFDAKFLYQTETNSSSLILHILHGSMNSYSKPWNKLHLEQKLSLSS